MEIINAILAVFTAMIGWFIEALNSASAIFFNSDSGTLTLLGSISLLSLAFSIVLFLFNWVRDILNFRR